METKTETLQVLLVEDDTDLSQLIMGRLSEEGYQTRHVEEGTKALEAVEEKTPDLVLLDIMLPGLDGLEVCRRLRAKHPLLYIMMLTARTDEVDRVVGLEVGADDYVTKPFSLKELLARIHSAGRRLRLVDQDTDGTLTEEEEEQVLEYDDLEIDPIRHEVRRGGELVDLTVREFDLLYFLARHPDRPFSRSQILDKVWDIEYEGYNRTIDSHVQRLRAKIEDEPSNPRFIKTVWGVGYKFQSEPPS